AIAKNGADLGLRDAARSPIARLLVAEAHQEVGATRSNHSPKAISKSMALLVGEHVEQPAIDHGIEPPRQREVEGVRDLELNFEAALFRLGLCLLDRGRRAVDSHGVE